MVTVQFICIIYTGHNENILTSSSFYFNSFLFYWYCNATTFGCERHFLFEILQSCCITNYLEENESSIILFLTEMVFRTDVIICIHVYVCSSSQLKNKLCSYEPQWINFVKIVFLKNHFHKSSSVKFCKLKPKCWFF